MEFGQDVKAGNEVIFPLSCLTGSEKIIMPRSLLIDKKTLK
jgi:hypothetical protein